LEENQQNQAVQNQQQSSEPIDETSVNKDIARLDVMNEEYNSMADKLREEKRKTN